MHEKVEHRWTVESLAAACGMSRSAFAARFKDLVGETPLEYLTSWRMQKASTLLKKGAGSWSKSRSPLATTPTLRSAKLSRESWALLPGSTAEVLLRRWGLRFNETTRSGIQYTPHRPGGISNTQATYNSAMHPQMRSSEQVRQVVDVRLVVDAIPTLVGSTRADGSAGFFNQRWLDYTGLSAELNSAPPVRRKGAAITAESCKPCC